ncbi:MAG: hypothetical protein JWM37_772 [Candidatus Saccharibacteria bacterium]|nr:hypothetical protein [Candidatus Saccharibacteria bacterium]
MIDIETVPHEARAVARFTQTDVTPSDVEAIYYGIVARHLWEEQPQELQEADPTLPAEITAKMGHRTARAGYPVEVVRDVFTDSHELLDSTQPAHERERVATYLLQGRTFGWLALNGKHEVEAPQLVRDATIAFATGAVLLRKLEAEGHTENDPYGVMLTRHRVTHESVAGIMPPKRVRKLALSGLKAALASRPENANTPEAAPSRFSPKHLKFVGKQAISHLANLPLVATMRYDHIPAVAQRRRQYAARMLG